MQRRSGECPALDIGRVGTGLCACSSDLRPESVPRRSDPWLQQPDPGPEQEQDVPLSAIHRTLPGRAVGQPVVLSPQVSQCADIIVTHRKVCKKLRLSSALEQLQYTSPWSP